MDSTLSLSVMAGKPELLDQVQDVCRYKHYSIRTEQAYVDWIKRYIHFHGRRHPKELSAAHVRDFLTHLAVKGKVSASTQNQAFSALLFLYQQVLREEIGLIENVERAKTSRRVPVVFTREEARAVLTQLAGTTRLMVELLYGSGLRLTECLRLRVKDIDFGHNQITVRDGKGAKDRVSVLPTNLSQRLREHRDSLRLTFHKDREASLPGVWIPEGLDRKFPKAGEQWEWQWFSPPRELMRDPAAGCVAGQGLSPRQTPY